MRGSDAGTPEMMAAQSAFWAGLLYDDATLDAVESLLRGMMWEDAVALRAAVPKQGLEAPWRGDTVRVLAREAVALARQGLRARHRLDAAGRDESIYIAPLEAIADGAPGQAEHWLDRYYGPWRGDVRRIFSEAEV
jgi:glutamate--cysteine ligase